MKGIDWLNQNQKKLNTKKYHIQQLKDGASFRLCYIPACTFAMGSNEKGVDIIWREDPIHDVSLSAYYIGEYPVTQSLWKAIMGADNNPSFFQGDNRPVEQVSWEDIVGKREETPSSFLFRLNEMTKNCRPANTAYRLPTEAEWECAARAEKPYSYAGGDKLKEVGWYELNSHEETKDVGMKQANDFGLFDMSGNVWEWCSDWYDDDYYQACYDKGVVKNPKGPDQGLNRVMRGGSWNHHSQYCRVASRHDHPPAYRYRIIGFRLVLSSQFGG